MTLDTRTFRELHIDVKTYKDDRNPPRPARVKELQSDIISELNVHANKLMERNQDYLIPCGVLTGRIAEDRHFIHGNWRNAFGSEVVVAHDLDYSDATPRVSIMVTKRIAYEENRKQSKSLRVGTRLIYEGNAQPNRECTISFIAQTGVNATNLLLDERLKSTLPYDDGTMIHLALNNKNVPGHLVAPRSTLVFYLTGKKAGTVEEFGYPTIDPKLTLRRAEELFPWIDVRGLTKQPMNKKAWDTVTTHLKSLAFIGRVLDENS